MSQIYYHPPQRLPSQSQQPPQQSTSMSTQQPTSITTQKQPLPPNIQHSSHSAPSLLPPFSPTQSPSPPSTSRSVLDSWNAPGPHHRQQQRLHSNTPTAETLYTGEASAGRDEDLPYVDPTPQARRLQLRNARFRGVSLASSPRSSPSLADKAAGSVSSKLPRPVAAQLNSSSSPAPPSASSSPLVSTASSRTTSHSFPAARTGFGFRPQQSDRRSPGSSDGNEHDLGSFGEEQRQYEQQLQFLEDRGYENEAVGSSSTPSHSPQHDTTSPYSFPAMHHQRGKDVSPSGKSVLQEISNSSLRRKRRDGPKPLSPELSLADMNSTPIKPWEIDQQALDELDMRSPEQRRPGTASSRASNAVKIRKTRSSRRTSRSSVSRRSISGGTAKYIEHLESQLVAAQTHLHSLTSPSSTAGQTAKLRAANNEVKLLREELEDWETKFEQRVLEQAEHHDQVTGTLNLQIRSLEKERESNDYRIKELEQENEERGKQLLAVEGANFDLERRLEFMSELIATSPSRERFAGGGMHQRHDSIDSATSQPRSVTSATGRPRSMVGFQRLSLITSGRHIPRGAGSNPLSPVRPDLRSTMGTPSPRDSYQADPFDQLIDVGKQISDASTEAESDLSESTTLIDVPSSVGLGISRPSAPETLSATSAPHSRRDSVTQPPIGHPMHPFPYQHYLTDDEARKRLPRRMRRFYTGSAGPKSLILPATTSAAAAAAYPLTAPLTNSPTPTMLHPRAPLSAHGHTRFGSRDMYANGSVVWDTDENSSQYGFQSSPGQSIANGSELGSGHPSSEDGEGRDGDDVGPGTRRNLFDELQELDNDNEQKEYDHDRRSSYAASSQGEETLRRRKGGSRPSTAIHATCADDALLVQDEKFNASFSSAATVRVRHAATLDTSRVDAGEKGDGEVVTLYNTNGLTRPLLFPRTFTPGNLLLHLLTLVSQSLNRQHPGAARVFSNAWSWSVESLSWPVVRFRWWLVRLLIGDIYKRCKEQQRKERNHSTRLRNLFAKDGVFNMAKDYVSSGSTGGTAASTSGKMTSNDHAAAKPEMIILWPGTIRRLGLMTIFEEEDEDRAMSSSSSPGKSKARSLRDKRVSMLSEDEYDVSSALSDLGSESESEANEEERDDEEAIHEGEGATGAVTSRDPRSGQLQIPPTPISWLKFSLTLVFAVGIAIKDGPGTLFLHPAAAASASRLT